MAVEIKGTESCYPHFKDGQVLTHNDLNQLRDFLYSKSLFHGRALIGFGVACGIEGALSGTQLEFSSGFAVAQDGLELIHPDGPAPARTFDLGEAANALAPETYSFVDAAQAGMTAILRPTETIEVADGTCGAAGCTTHTDRHCQGAEIVWVQGQLRLSSLEDHPALKLLPIVPRDNPALAGYENLRVAVKAQLRGLSMEAATVNLLDTMKLTGPKGIDLLKVGLVNEVLYTLWDYIACKRAQNVPCFGETGVPAVALGHALKAGSAWTWNQRFRHYFRLSLALTRAMHGYRGQDLCERHIDHIRALIQDFTPPPVPTTPADVKEPEVDFHICKGKSVALGHCKDWKGSYRRPEDRYAWIDPSRRREAKFRDPLWDPNPVEDNALELVGHLSEVDPVAAGVFNSYPLLGRRAASVETMLVGLIKAEGVAPDIHRVDQATFEADATLQPTLFASITDSVYIGQNSAGAMTGMAIKPTLQVLGNVREITVNANQAVTEAHTAVAQTAGYGTRFVTAETQITEVKRGLATFEREVADGFSGLRADAFQEINDLRAELPPAAKLTKAVALADDFGELSGDVRELKTRFELQDRRAVPGGGFVVGDRAVEANQALRGALASIRTAIERSATTRQLAKVREALDAVEPQIRQLDEATESGMLMTAAQPEALATVLEGITNAVVAAGVETNSVEFSNLRNGVDALRSTMGVPRA